MTSPRRGPSLNTVLMRTAGLLLAMLASTAACANQHAPSTQAVEFPDAKLETAIRQAIDKPSGDISYADLAGLTELVASGRGIADLSGLERCTKLTKLDLGASDVPELYSNDIRDILPLAGLARLTQLDLA